jgi:hypothetical protein
MVREVLKWVLKKEDGRAWAGFICLRTAANGGVLANAVMNLRVP